MRFFKENSEGIIKLFVNQIGIAIFSFFLYTAAGAMQKDGAQTPTYVKVLISVFSLAFYFALLFYAAWEMGAKDKIRIDGGRAERKPLRGLLMGLYSNIPNFVFTGISLICFGIYMLSSSEGFKTVFFVLNAIFRIFISMYLGVVEGLTASFADDINLYYLVQTALFFILPVLTVITVHFSYIMGLHEKRIFPAKRGKDK